VKVITPANRALMTTRRDRLRRRGWIALVCAPLGLAPFVITVVLSDRVATDKQVVIAGLSMFFGILGAIPVCLKLSWDSFAEARRVTKFLSDGITPEPPRLRRPPKWLHPIFLVVALIHNPVAMFRGTEKCFGVYAAPWWMVALTLFLFLEGTSLYLWLRSLRPRVRGRSFAHKI
jgi:hypothetical protein